MCQGEAGPGRCRRVSLSVREPKVELAPQARLVSGAATAEPPSRTDETYWCAVCVLELRESPCWCCGASLEINSPGLHPVEGSAGRGMEVEL